MPELGELRILDRLEHHRALSSYSVPSPNMESTQEAGSGTGEYVCPICKYKSDDKHCFHYGGVSCYSCRAFFRRAHQSTKSPNFKCKNNNNCEISVKTRRKCQKCRYELCLRSGMDPELVLNEEQKKVRFRNYLKKKAKQQNHDHQSSSNRSTPEACTSDDSTTSPPRSLPPLSYIDSSNRSQVNSRMDITGEMEQPRAHIFGQYRNEASYMPVLAIMNQVNSQRSPPGGHNYGEQRYLHHATMESEEHGDLNGKNYGPLYRETGKRQYPYTNSYDSSPRKRPCIVPLSPKIPQQDAEDHFTSYSSTKRNDALPSEMEPKREEFSPIDLQKDKDKRMEQIQQSHFLAIAQKTTSPKFIDEIQTFHQTCSGTTISVNHFYGHLFRLGTQFQQFANLRNEFGKLSGGDQTALLEKNTTLFLLYILVQYFQGKTGEEQLRWILDENLPRNLSTSHVPFTSFEDINSHIKLVEPEFVSLFKSYMDDVTSFGLDYHYTGLVCNLILFNNDTSMKLEDSTLVNANFIEALEILRHSHMQLGIHIPTEKVLKMMKYLGKMSETLKEKSVWVKNSLPNLPFLQIPLPFTHDEEDWSLQELQWFDYAWAEHLVDNDTMKGMVEFTLGAHMPKGFLPNVINLFLHRIRKVALNQPEFKTLPVTDQNKFWSRNCMSCLALALMKLESSTSGYEQMRIISGHMGSPSEWEASIPHVDPRKLKSLSLIDFEGHNGRLTGGEVMQFMHMSRQYMGFLQDDVNFKLFLSILLFDGDTGVLNPSVSRIRDSYIKLLKRRISLVSSNHHQTHADLLPDLIAMIGKARTIIPKIEV